MWTFSHCFGTVSNVYFYSLNSWEDVQFTNLLPVHRPEVQAALHIPDHFNRQNDWEECRCWFGFLSGLSWPGAIYKSAYSVTPCLRYTSKSTMIPRPSLRYTSWQYLNLLLNIKAQFSPSSIRWISRANRFAFLSITETPTWPASSWAGSGTSWISLRLAYQCSL